MMPTKILLLLTSFVCVVSGIYYAIDPTQIMAMADITLESPQAKVEIYAYYSGVQIAFGLLFLLCALNAELNRAGLLFVIFVFGGMAIGRAISLTLVGTINGYNLSGLLFESFFFLTGLSIWIVSREMKNALPEEKPAHS